MPSAPQRIRVLLVDDHAVIRTGLRMVIDADPQCIVVGEAGARADACAAAQEAQPDIILLDLDLGEERGIDFMRDLTAVAPTARVLVLTGIRDPVLHEEAVRLGAKGVLLKDKAAGSLMKAIQKVHAGELWLDRSLTAELITALTTRNAYDGPKDPEQAKIAMLTAREREIVELVATGLRNKDIADRLFISETTVRHHLTSIFAKVEVSDRLSLVLYAFRYGLAKLHP